MRVRLINLQPIFPLENRVNRTNKVRVTKILLKNFYKNILQKENNSIYFDMWVAICYLKGNTLWQVYDLLLAQRSCACNIRGNIQCNTLSNIRSNTWCNTLCNIQSDAY